MSVLIIDKHGVDLSYADGCLLLREPEQSVRSLPLGRITKVLCLHGVTISSQLLGQLYDRGIDWVVLNSRYANFSFGLFAPTHKHAKRRCMQYLWQMQEQMRLEIAKQFCLHKFRNSWRACYRNASPALLQQLQQGIVSISVMQTEQQLRGLEGSVQRAMFDYWRGQIPDKWGFKQRQRRPPPDPVNALLSFAYTLVHQEAVRQAKRYGLDPSLGFYHRLAYGRHSLACDLMEPMRPKVDAFIFILLARSVLDLRHFTKPGPKGCFLGKEGRLLFYPEFDEFMLGASRSLAAQARWLARCIDLLETPNLLPGTEP